MASAKALFGAAFGRFLFRDASVTSVRSIPVAAATAKGGFRIVELEGADLQGVAWTPGDKVQFFLPGVGMRTYTPTSWDPTRGRATFFLYVHGTRSPGARWASELAVGTAARLFGPRRSLDFSSLAGEETTLFGDETSFAAAMALSGVRRARCVFEVTSERASREALDAVGIEATLLERAPADAHLDAVGRALENTPPSSLVFTGRAQSIQALRARGLRAASTKAYWSDGKSGLD